MMRQHLQDSLQQVLADLGVKEITVQLDTPANPQFGDYATNVGLAAAKQLGKSPREIAENMVAILNSQFSILNLQRIEVAGPGFINFYLTPEAYVSSINSRLKEKRTKFADTLAGKKIMVEYAHPNTHKEMHIGHMRTLVIGEALARLAEAAGATVFRANYQGDIGLHVAKALYGVQVMMEEHVLSVGKIETWGNAEKAHFLGQAYARGSQDYEAKKEAIDRINKALYTKDNDELNALYKVTRQWSLDYYADFYERFYTQYDRLFFESETADLGKKIVEDHIGGIFEQQNGAVIFPGERYGLHTRVFITQAGNPTYEGKDMGLGFMEYEAFPFDTCIHVVASEQAGYFQVVIKALQLLDAEKFKGEYHLSMGMVQLKDRKMSSRTGDVLTVDWLLDQVKERVSQMASEGRISSSEKDKTIEQIVIGAVKYSVLKVGATQDVAFDIETSVSLDGNSGPYLQYTYARTQSVLRKAGGLKQEASWKMENGKWKLESEELALLRLLSKFEEVVSDAAEKYSPNILTNYLFDLAQAFNLFYQKSPILRSEGEIKAFRLALTAAVGQTMQSGLDLLGIQAPAQM